MPLVVALPDVKQAAGTGVVGGALISMAIVKAGLVGLFFMHLRHEAVALKWIVALPFLAPALYAVVLIGEAAWRIGHGQLQGAFP